MIIVPIIIIMILFPDSETKPINSAQIMPVLDLAILEARRSAVIQNALSLITMS